MKRATKINLLLVLAVVLLACLPVVLGMGDDKEEPFAGADAQAETAIAENDPDYEPWFSPLYEPPSGEIESGLFALQAAVGAGVVGYLFGVVRTRRKLGTVGSAAEDGAVVAVGSEAAGRPVPGGRQGPVGSEPDAAVAASGSGAQVGARGGPSAAADRASDPVTGDPAAEPRS